MLKLYLLLSFPALFLFIYSLEGFFVFISLLLALVANVIRWCFDLIARHKAFTVLVLSIATATMLDFIFIDYGRGVMQNYYKAINWDRKTAAAGQMDTPFNLSFLNLTHSSCPDNKYSLTVTATPPTSRIRIMNIKPKYRPDICLTPRRYDIYVTHRGYHSYRKWITIKEADVSLEVTLTRLKT
jgi:hypothetical protein